MTSPAHLLVLLGLLWAQPYIQAQRYRTFTDIRTLVRVERNLIDRLLDYFQRQEKKGVHIDSSAIKFVELANKNNKKANQTLARNEDNPLFSYHCVKRATNDWTSLKQNLSCTGPDCPILTGEDVFKAAVKRNEISWPEKEDLQYAALSIIQIWTVHDLDLSDIVSGKVKDVQNAPLALDDVFFIASTAKDVGKDYEALTWFQYLVNNTASLSGDSGMTKAFLYRRLAGTYQQYGMTWKSVELLDEYQKSDPDDKAVSRDLKYFRSSVSSSAKKKELKRFQDNDKAREVRNIQQYEDVCRGGNKVSTRLLCYIRPLYQTYGVVKMEEIHGYPRILLYYDVINDKEIRALVKAASSRVHKNGVAEEGIVSTRMCERHLDIPGVMRMTQRLGQVTGLGLSTYLSICYKFSSHATGGTYTPVVDFSGMPKVGKWLKETVNIRGENVATVMFQLSDVSYGGETVFPKIHASIPVVKGSMALWYNLRSSGHPDIRTSHIECPVLVGTKWTAIKKIQYNRLIARRVCDAKTGRG